MFFLGFDTKFPKREEKREEKMKNANETTHSVIRPLLLLDVLVIDATIPIYAIF